MPTCPPARPPGFADASDLAARVVVRSAEDDAAIAAARLLMREYAAALAIDLTFQDFEAELATLPGRYAPPDGALRLATVDGALAGCGALRPLSRADGLGELKRLYVRPAFRGLGLGQRLVRALLEDGRQLGYRALLLDTLPAMASARRLYAELGFVEIPPYYDSPIAGTRFLRRELYRPGVPAAPAAPGESVQVRPVPAYDDRMPDLTPPAAASFELHAGALRLALRPDLGGSIAGLWHRDQPILRSTEPGELSAARASACYPLVPYSNRVAYARFRWKGHDYTTRPNFDASPHSVHGVGWQRPWQIVSSNTVEVVMRLVHPGDADWPFPFEVSQYIDLAPDSLRLQLVYTNTGDQPQPVGLGWHPYFTRRSRSRLHIELSDRWDADAAELPVRKVAQPGIDADVAHLDFDNCFDGWRGPARIRDEKFSLQLTSSVDRLVVYTPQTKPYFCVEPVSHVSNAIHMADPMAHGLRSVAPGESFQASLQLDVAVV